MSNKDSFYDKIDEFELELDFDKKLNLLIELLSIFDKIPNGLIDCKDYYIIGYSYYNLENHDFDYVAIAKSYFIKSLDINPDYNMSRLYLAHCYQDCHEFNEALSNYLKVNQPELKAEFPIWRFVKLIEQIGYCYYIIGDKDNGLRYFNQVLEYYQKLPQIELAYPVELLNCLPDDNVIKIEMKKINNAT